MIALTKIDSSQSEGSTFVRRRVKTRINESISHYLEIDKLYTQLSLIKGVIQYGLRRHYTVNYDSDSILFFRFSSTDIFRKRKCVRKSLCAI